MFVIWYLCSENVFKPEFPKSYCYRNKLVMFWSQNRWSFLSLFVSKSVSTLVHAFILDMTVDLYFKLSLVKILNVLGDWLACWTQVYHENWRDLTLQCSISLPCHSNLNETHILIAIYSVPKCQAQSAWLCPLQLWVESLPSAEECFLCYAITW